MQTLNILQSNFSIFTKYHIFHCLFLIPLYNSHKPFQDDLTQNFLYCLASSTSSSNIYQRSMKVDLVYDIPDCKHFFSLFANNFFNILYVHLFNDIGLYSIILCGLSLLSINTTNEIFPPSPFKHSSDTS